MKERFDTKTQDIFLYLTQDELQEFLGIQGIGGMKLVSHEKRATLILFRDVSTPKNFSRTIDVQAAYDVPGRDGSDYTTFVINVSETGCNQLRFKGLCEDRYTGLTGSE